MLSRSDNNQVDFIVAFDSNSRYLDDLLDIDNPYFKQMVGQIYSTELQLRSKKESKDHESIQSCTTPDQGHHMGK